MYNGDRIGAEDLRNLVQKKPEFSDTLSNSGPQGDVQTQGIQDILSLRYTEAKNIFEKQYLEFQLAQHECIISRKAEAIGIYPSNLHAKLRKYNIRIGR
jgi:two-component system nitrogen regulation response regulator NtrX